MTQDPNAASPLLNLPGTGDAADIDLGGTPRPWWRRRGPIIGISVALLVILLGGLLFTLLNRKPPVKYEYQPVQIRNLALTISATGPLTSAVYNLVFNGQSAGVIIHEIDVTVGQKVVAGQVVPKLNKTSLQDVYNEQLADVRTDQNNLNSAMNELLKTEGLTNANVASAQTSLSNSRASLTTTLAASQQAVVVAETTLSNDQASLAQATTVANAQIAQALLTEQTAIAACTTPPTQPCIQAAKDAYNVAVASANAPVQTAQNAVNAAQQTLNQATATARIQTAQNAVNTAQQALNQARATANANNQTAQAKVTADQQALNQAR